MDLYRMLEQNANTLGVENVLTQCMEECAELVQACNRFLRASGIGLKTDMEPGEALYNLMEETVDVSIMMAELSYLLQFDKQLVDGVMFQKILRTNKKLFSEERTGSND